MTAHPPPGAPPPEPFRLVTDPDLPALAPRRALPGRLVWVVWAGVALILLLLDQATKYVAERGLANGRVIDLGFIDLRLVHNPGGAFGFPGLPGMFVVVTLVVLVLVLRALPRTDRLALATAYGLVTGGAFGNLVDRLLRDPGFPRGEVVDFFDLGWWPVFNVADIAIVSGAGLIAVLLTAVDREERLEDRRRQAHRSVRPQTTLVPEADGSGGLPEGNGAHGAKDAGNPQADAGES